MGDEKNDFYANGVQVTTSLYDVNLGFKTESPIFDKEGKPTATTPIATFNVRMSPQHAKALVSILAKHVVDYEKDHNITLPIPPEVEKWWKAYINVSGEMLH